MRHTQTTAATPRELRSFGLLIGGVVTVIWTYRWFTYGHRSVVLGVIALVFLVCGACFPHALRYLHRVWMALGERMGAIVSRVFLAVFYYVFFTPIAFLRRRVVRDPLECAFDRRARSYFHEKRIQPREQLERMF